MNCETIISAISAFATVGATIVALWIINCINSILRKKAKTNAHIDN